MAIERYIGGGKIHMSLYNGTDYDAEVEIGEITEAKVSITQNYAEAFSKDTGISKKVDKVATSTDAKVTFTTQNINKENLRMAMFGVVGTETFAIGDTLPDGTVAAAETTIDFIDGGKLSKIEAKLRIVGTNVTDGKNPVMMIHHAVITPTGDARDYFADNHSTLGFEGEILEIGGEYFKEYLMD
jgi:hypothetical protein